MRYFSTLSFLLSLLLLSLACKGQFEDVFDVPNGNTVYALESNDSYVFTGTGGNGIWRSSDNGETWTDINNGIVAWYYFSLLSAGDTLFAGSFGIVNMSTNNGDSWTDLNIGLDLNDNILSLSKHGDFLWAGVSNKGVYRCWLNTGEWITVNSGLHLNPTVNDIIAIGTDFYAATDAGVYKLTENAADWVLLDNGLPNAIQINQLFFSNSVLLAGTSGGLYKSVDLGESWSLISSGVTSNLNVKSFAQMGGLLFLGSQNGVYQSNNMGDNWFSINQGLSNQLFVTSMNAQNNYLFVGASGNIFRNESFPLSTGQTDDFQNTALIVYPNPTIDRVAIVGNQSELKSITFFDLHGRHVKTIKGEENEIDVSDLPSGTYSILITTAKNNTVQKLIKR
jgi:photosystem II stability/assembly factor-like uncharacterized protein